MQTAGMFAHGPSNRERNIWAVSLLDVQPTDRVLEIGFGPGFGPGVAIAEFADRATRGHVFGIDHSQAMVRQAARRNAAASAPAACTSRTPQPRRPGATRDTTARAAQELQDMLTLAVMTADSTPTSFPASLRLISSGLSCGGAATSHPTFRPR
ncbi:hypothetical protein [Nonomuraea indica]|uniref:Methyltransferase domain-containing protein n=1 Tax=Nonomuraea indica TaxID=1581193 RepID=A0ABW7ZXW9_9ACTN